MRDPPSEAFDGIAKNIFGVELNSGKAKWVIKRIRETLTDFRNKYNDGVLKLVEDYKRTRYFFILFCFFFYTGLIMVLILIKFYL